MGKIPDWVKNYPHEMDKAALTSLAEATDGTFDKPREMNFSLYDFSEDRALQEAAAKAHEAGWVCQAYTQEDDPSRFVLEAQKQDYAITQENYERDSAFFMRLADLYKAKYDGWFASN
jgi:hypothetical protein